MAKMDLKTGANGSGNIEKLISVQIYINGRIEGNK